MATCGTITVTSAFDPSDVEVSCNAGGEIEVGEDETVTISVSNQNETAASYTGSVTVDGSAVETFSGTLNAGRSTSENVTLAFDEPGNYSIGVNVNAEEA